jgi:Family of unknown function (DUF6098)
VRTIEDFDELADLVQRHRGLFVRHSHGPQADASGPSRDYESGLDLPGWSVTDLDPEPWWTRPVADWVARRVCKYLELSEAGDQRPWVLTGRVVGRGPDHEPLVVDIEPIAWIAPQVVEQAKERYHGRFDVGRTSVG